MTKTQTQFNSFQEDEDDETEQFDDIFKLTQEDLDDIEQQLKKGSPRKLTKNDTSISQTESIVKTTKDDVLDEILQNNEYLKTTLKGLTIEQQLETMINLAGDQIKNNDELAQKIRKDYCYSKGILYKIMTLLGFSEDNAETFSKWYIETAYSMKTSMILNTIKSTFSFMYNWKGLLAILLANIWFLYRARDALLAIKGFIADNEYTISWIRETIRAGGELTGVGMSYINKLFEYINYYLSTNISLTPVIDFIGRNMDKIDEWDWYFATGQLDEDIIMIGWWSAIVLGGVAVFMWVIYVISSLLNSESEIDKFCAGDF